MFIFESGLHCYISPLTCIFCFNILIPLSFFLFLGLPYYNPSFEKDMSSSAFASTLKILGGGFKTKNPGSTAGSGSGSQREDAAESSAPRVEPVIQAEDDGKVDEVVEIVAGPEKPARKKRKVVGFKPPKGNEPVIEKVACDKTCKDQEGDPVQVGSFTLEQLATTMSEIPTEEDWTDMEESSLSTVLKQLTGHGGHVSFSL